MNVRDARSSLVSVIIPCFGQFGLIRRCVVSLGCLPRCLWELADRGDGSTDYLSGFADAASFLVTSPRAPESPGYPTACDTRVGAARGDFVLLNNDVVVIDGRLDQLSEGVLHADLGAMEWFAHRHPFMHRRPTTSMRIRGAEGSRN